MAVLLSPVGGAAAQFLDNNGNPLLAGKLYTYVAGTTTNQATYTSSSGVTPHTNPIILDAGGRVPGGEIWLTDGLQYKFVLKNANDVLIGTYDNLVGINSNFVNFLTETEVQTATAGQTVFTLTTMQYQPATNNLTVYVDGVNQIDGATYSYVETSSTVVTFTAGLHVGALVKFTTAQTLSTGVTDASLVTYSPPFTASVATTVENKLAQTVSVLDFGADPTGVADSTQAFVDAFASILATRTTGATGGDAYGSASVLFIPTGKYKTTAPITPANYCNIVGENSIIEPTPTNFSVFNNIGYATRFENLIFVGGQIALDIATGNVDTTTIIISGCEFHDQVTHAIKTNTNSPSTRLTIENCKFYNTRTSCTLVAIASCDLCTITGGWASVAGTFVQSGSSTTQAEVYVSGVCGVPIGGSTIWGVNYSTMTWYDCRFGGETAATGIINYAKIDGATPNILSIQMCQTYFGSAYVVDFAELPNTFICKNNRGFSATDGFFFRAGISNLLDARGLTCDWIVENNNIENIEMRGLAGAMSTVSTLSNYSVLGSGTLLVSDKVAQAAANTATGGALVNVTVTNTTGMFGQATRTYVGNNAAYDGTISETWNNQLTGLTTGMYTAVFEIDIQAVPLTSVTFLAANNSQSFNAKQGKHVVCVPFYWNSAASTNTVGWSFDALNNAQQVSLGSVRVFKGEALVTTINNQLYATAVPTTLRYEVGDKVINSAPTVGQPKSWVCTVAGTPGTWVSEGNL